MWSWLIDYHWWLLYCSIDFIRVVIARDHCVLCLPERSLSPSRSRSAVMVVAWASLARASIVAVVVVSLFTAVVTAVIWPTIVHVIWLAAATAAQIVGIVVVIVMVSATVVVTTPVMAMMIPATPLVLISTVPVIATTAPTYLCWVSPTITQVTLRRIQVIVVCGRGGPSTSVIVDAPTTTQVCIPARTCTFLGWLSG